MVSYSLVRHPHGSLSSVLRAVKHSQLVFLALPFIVPADITRVTPQIACKAL